MNLLTLAEKNLKRHKTRTLLTVLGVGVAAATLFTILSFDAGYEKALHEEIAGSGIHLFVSTEGCPLEAAALILHGGEIPKFLQMERLREVKAVEGVKEAAGFLIFSLSSPTDGKIDLFYGITDEALKLKKNWKVRGSWFKDESSIILGSEVARVEKREVGDKVYLESLDREFIVAGILERTFGQDDGFYYLSLSAAQKLFKKENKLTAVGVQLTDVLHLQKVKDRLETLPDVYVVTSEQMSGEIMRFIGGTKALMYSVLIVALVVSAIGILNTVLMATMERQREFGYMRCVGAGKRDLVWLVLLETAGVCLVGWLVGVSAGFVLSSGTEHWMRQFLAYVPAGQLLRPNAQVVGASIVVTLALGLLAGLYPALKVARVSPMEAIRNE
jgi:putative ABC transport system permease protein